MADKQSAKKPPSPGKIIVLGAAATTLALFNMYSGGEAPSQGVLILQYLFLGLGLIGLAGGAIMMMSQK